MIAGEPPPSDDHGDVDAVYDKPEDAPFDLDDELLCQPCEDVEQDGEGQSSQIHRALPGPKTPSKEEVRRHNVNHWPYRNWCPWCVMGRRNAEPHMICPTPGL